MQCRKKAANRNYGMWDNWNVSLHNAAFIYAHQDIIPFRANHVMQSTENKWETVIQPNWGMK